MHSLSLINSFLSLTNWRENNKLKKESAQLRKRGANQEGNIERKSVIKRENARKRKVSNQGRKSLNSRMCFYSFIFFIDITTNL